MTAPTATLRTQDWRTADPVWADDLRSGHTSGVISTGLFAASIGLMALVAAVVAVLA